MAVHMGVLGSAHEWGKGRSDVCKHGKSMRGDMSRWLDGRSHMARVEHRLESHGSRDEMNLCLDGLPELN